MTKEELAAERHKKFENAWRRGMYLLRDDREITFEEYSEGKKRGNDLMREQIGSYTLKGWKMLDDVKLDGAEYPNYRWATFAHFNGITRKHMNFARVWIPDWDKPPEVMHISIELEQMVRIADYIKEGVDWEAEDPKAVDYYNKYVKPKEDKENGNTKREIHSTESKTSTTSDSVGSDSNGASVADQIGKSQCNESDGASLQRGTCEACGGSGVRRGHWNSIGIAVSPSGSTEDGDAEEDAECRLPAEGNESVGDRVSDLDVRSTHSSWLSQVRLYWSRICKRWLRREDASDEGDEGNVTEAQTSDDASDSQDLAERFERRRISRAGYADAELCRRIQK